MATWPATLPPPLLAGFSETLADDVLRSPMDMGPDKVRLRSTSNAGSMSVPYLLTNDQLDDLLDFFRGDGARGAASFDYEHPRTGDTISCRFAAPVQYSTTDGKNFATTIELVVLP